jgi:NAD-dependent deacetylase
MPGAASAAAVADWLRQARRVVALTGAGISVESGIPTFRGAGGLWREFRAEDLATPQAFARDPALVWEWYLWRRGLIAKAEPNAGHRALAEMEVSVPFPMPLADARGSEALIRSSGGGFTLITQNVDGLHDRAGSRHILKLHGDIWTTRCANCDAEIQGDTRLGFDELPPHCSEPGCKGLLRPGVVWFGEALPQYVWDAAERAVRRADLVLVIGTSAVVYPAASLAPLARSAGARIVEINIDETPMSGAVDASLRGPGGVILPELLSAAAAITSANTTTTDE